MAFFDRICAMTAIIESFLDIDENGNSAGALALELAKAPKYIFHVDGDSFVFNGDMPLSSLVANWPAKDVMFYERFRNGEIMAGNYALTVSHYALEFMRGWDRLHEDGNFYFSNWDNGALHIQALYSVKDELTYDESMPYNASTMIAYLKDRWRRSNGVPEYDRYVAAVKLALGSKRSFKRLHLFRRGHAFCVDDDIGSTSLAKLSKGSHTDRFLCVHGPKAKVDLLKEVGPTCVSEVMQCTASLLTCTKPPRDSEELKRAIRNAQPQRLALGQVNDVADCWPDCPVDLTQETWASLRKSLQSAVDCEATYDWPLQSSCYDALRQSKLRHSKLVTNQ
eukprot:TRINITY_DN42029_c0_g1_i1.p1 TRINITY_DN42029_c0_g1~~TRINITY_DN42029_c0_g1_i1.p1  ORF type:complete len:337 (-),score=27.48 TRINITY_DN42029_c0_g1_i1:44-1054(-)